MKFTNEAQGYKVAFKSQVLYLENGEAALTYSEHCQNGYYADLLHNIPLHCSICSPCSIVRVFTQLCMHAVRLHYLALCQC